MSYQVTKKGGQPKRMSGCGTARSQDRRSADRAPALLMYSEDAEKRGEDVGVELGGRAAQELGDRVLRVRSRPIRAVLSHRIVGIDDGNDACREGNVWAGEPLGIASPVEPFV